MDHLGVRDLRANLAAVVERAAAGERIVVTVAGRPVAQIGPLEPIGGDATLDDLAARGLLVLPRRPDRPDPAANLEPWAGVRLDRLLAEVRGR
jgi:prevent-host-death family protein